MTSIDVVSVLSILVTTLIGWQIYTIVNFNAEKKKMKEEVDVVTSELKRQMELNSFESNQTQAAIMSDLASLYMDGQEDFKFVNYSLTAVMYALRNNDYDFAKINIKAVLEYGENGLQMNDQRKGMLLNIFYRAIKPAYIWEGVNELERLLIGIKL